MENDAPQSTLMLASTTAIRKKVTVGLAGRGLLLRSESKTGSIGRSEIR